MAACVHGLNPRFCADCQAAAIADNAPLPGSVDVRGAVKTKAISARPCSLGGEEIQQGDTFGLLNGDWICEPCIEINGGWRSTPKKKVPAKKAVKKPG